MPKQDPQIKTDPYSARLDRHGAQHDYYTVKSASSDRHYEVALTVEDGGEDRCSCPASGPCWHLDMARLRRQCDRAYTNSTNLYRNYRLADLQAEEAFLVARLAEVDSWLTRAQLGALGDAIAELVAATPAA